VKFATVLPAFLFMSLTLNASQSTWLTNVSNKDLVLVVDLITDAKGNFWQSENGKAVSHPLTDRLAIKFPKLTTIQFDAVDYQMDGICRLVVEDPATGRSILGKGFIYFGTVASGRPEPAKLTYNPKGDTSPGFRVDPPAGTPVGGTHMTISSVLGESETEESKKN